MENTLECLHDFRLYLQLHQHPLTFAASNQNLLLIRTEPSAKERCYLYQK